MVGECRVDGVIFWLPVASWSENVVVMVSSSLTLAKSLLTSFSAVCSLPVA